MTSCFADSRRYCPLRTVKEGDEGKGVLDSDQGRWDDTYLASASLQNHRISYLCQGISITSTLTHPRYACHHDHPSSLCFYSFPR